MAGNHRATDPPYASEKERNLNDDELYDSHREYNLTKITERSKDEEPSSSRMTSGVNLDGDDLPGIKDDVKQILSSAIRKDEEMENEQLSFYSNANDSSVLSNRQRLNDTHPPSRDIGEHLMSEAMRNKH